VETERYRCDYGDRYHPKINDEFSGLWWLDWDADDEPNVDMDLLERLRNQDFDGNGAPHWTMPKVNWRFITSSDQKASLSNMRAEFDVDRDTDTIKMTLKSTGYESLEIEVSMLTTFETII
jgi:hypothetical protein